MRQSMICSLPFSILFSLSLLIMRIPGQEKEHAPLISGQHGVVVGTTGPLAVHAGLEVLKAKGSAVDAAVTTALAQVVECGGSYVSHAGIFSMLYFDASTGKIHFLNACYNTPMEEKDPMSIPKPGTPSGRTALVPGFMAGVLAAHDRFGKLPRSRVFQPSIDMAREGMKVNALLGRFLKSRQKTLSRLPDTKRIFTKTDGVFYQEGELLKQSELADTLEQVVSQGASHIYTGDWAKAFVAAVQKEGGKITMEDMKAYQVIWEEPLRTIHQGHDVIVPGFSSLGGVNMIEALHLVDQAGISKLKHYSQSAESFSRLARIANCQVLCFLSDQQLIQFQGMDLSHRSRIKKETAEAIWKRMSDGTWPFGAEKKQSGTPPGHSDGIAVVDAQGNIAVVTHSINTTLWGDTGLFVGGISIPDSATFQQDALKNTGPGKRLPDPMCPLIVLKEGKPLLASSAIGGGLHQRSLSILVNLLDQAMEPQAAVDQPAFMLPQLTTTPPVTQIEKGEFKSDLLKDINDLGTKVNELNTSEGAAYRGYWVGVHIDPKTGMRNGLGIKKPPLPAVARGY